ncbi:MAG: pyruvate formate lyase family protein, partial [Clostridia bacterium]|nr:pyruvate formate lyase family protein [Clostridia bacterium]
MTERVKRLREQSLGTAAHIDMERARLETECCKLYEGTMSVPELRAAVLKYIMEHKTLYFGDEELIVGEKGASIQMAPTFPELCCHTVDDMLTMDRRELISFKVTDDDIALQRDVMIPYWENRSMRKKLLDAMSDEWKACYEAGIFTEFMEQRGPGHTVGSEKIYKKGFLDYKDDISAAMDALDFENDAEAVSRLEQLRAMDTACDAVIILGERYRKLALSLLEKETNKKRREELQTIADNLAVVPAHKPETFYQ